MKIACIANFRIPSSITPVIQTIRLCEGFEQAGHDVTLYYPDREQPADLETTTIYEYYDVEHRFRTKPRPCIDPSSSEDRSEGHTLLSRRTLSRASFTVPNALSMRFADADLYITRGVPTGALLVALGLPTVLESYSAPSYWNSPGRMLVPLMNLSDAFRSIVVPTEQIADAWQERGFSEDRTLVLPTAVDLANYSDERSKAEARRELGLPTDKNLVVYTGKLIPARGSRVVAEACKDMADTEVVLVGGSDEEIDRMRQYLERNGIDNVRLEGWVRPPKVPLYQWAADVLVSATKPGEFNPQEAVPLKIVEYMAAQRPIVASNIEGIRAVLEHEENAILVEPGDPEAVRDGIERVLRNSDLGTRIADRAAHKASEYSWKRRAERIVAAAAEQS